MKNQDDKFDSWRKRANSLLPGLAARVFALRNEMYSGCGFHYGLEKTLGYCLSRLNDYGKYPEWWEQVVLRTALEKLIKDVTTIEREVLLRKNK